MWVSGGSADGAGSSCLCNKLSTNFHLIYSFCSAASPLLVEKF